MKKILMILLIAGVQSGLVAQNLDEIVLKDAGSGNQFEMRSLKSDKASVIIFFGNSCAYNEYYIDRIEQLAAEFSKSGIRFILVNSNKKETLSADAELKMKNYLSETKLKLPYLVDAKQSLKKALSATRSPEVFLISSSGGNLNKHYSGAIDDSPQDEGDVSHPYLREAILSLLQGNTPELNHVRPAGCLIR